MSEATVIDRHVDQWGEWTDVWLCEPPAVGATFHVLRADWDEDYTIRTIHEIRLVTT